jgi:AraC family transcriptional regulator, transcriptional activator of pobA
LQLTPKLASTRAMKKIPIRKINTQSEPNLSGNFDIRDISQLLGGKDMVQELHRHDFFYMLVLEKGSGHHEIDFTSYKIHDYCVFLMRPGQVHQLKLKARSTGYLVEFNMNFYRQYNHESNHLLENAGSHNLYQLDGKQFKKLSALLNNIIIEYADKQQGYEEAIKAHMRVLFIELLRQTSKSGASVNLYMQEQLQKLSRLLETHIAEHKEVSEYADMLHLSPFQLNTITKTTLGKTCSKLITEYVILEAKRHLLATPNQINQIAYHLGYEDASYFIRFFKKHTGYTPEAFRQNFG